MGVPDSKPDLTKSAVSCVCTLSLEQAVKMNANRQKITLTKALSGSQNETITDEGMEKDLDTFPFRMVG